jgi:hypothetical protein
LSWVEKKFVMAVRRADLPAVRAALEAVGFIYHHLIDIDTFIDGPQGNPSGVIHILFAGEKVRRNDDFELPVLDESERDLACPLPAAARRSTTTVARQPERVMVSPLTRKSLPLCRVSP